MLVATVAPPQDALPGPAADPASPAPARRSRTYRVLRPLGVLICAVAAVAAVVVPAMASARPVVLAISAHRGPYWGGTKITVTGRNFTDVRHVTFGAKKARSVHVVSPTKLTLVAPYHRYGKVYVRVRTSAGLSSHTAAARFTFARPTMNDPIQGGLTGRQEQRISAKVRAHHHNAHVARRSRHWTAAMGLTAVRRAASWLGVPYSWAGGNGSGPTTGVCAHNGGDLDCHIVGFDCSGLTLYSWWPYEHLVHYAATQHHQAGKFHPTIGELVPGDLVYFAGYIAGGIGHTAIYAGNGTVIQAPESGEVVMRSLLSDVIAANGVYRGATRPMTSGRQGAGPQVTSVTTTMTTKGGNIVITGKKLTGTTTVTIGGTTRYRFTSRTQHRLVVAAPAHSAGRVTVAVSNAWGTVRRRLTYVAPAQLAALSPATGPTAGGTVVTISGQGLAAVTTATVAGVAVPVHVVSATQATITMPAHVAGVAAVALASPYGTSNALPYTYADPDPYPSATAGTHPRTTSTSTTPTSTSASPTPVPTSHVPTSPVSTTPSTTPISTTPVPTTSTAGGSTSAVTTTPADAPSGSTSSSVTPAPG